MNIRNYLDSTYLKTDAQAGLSESENIVVAQGFIQEAIDEDFKLIMIQLKTNVTYNFTKFADCYI